MARTAPVATPASLAFPEHQTVAVEVPETIRIGGREARFVRWRAGGTSRKIELFLTDDSSLTAEYLVTTAVKQNQR